MTNLSSVRGESKAQALSNSAKLLAGYMRSTGTFEAKVIAEALAIPVRTIQRLKLEIACANDAMCGAYSEHAPTANAATSATDGGANSANCAVDGVSGAPTAPPVAFSEPENPRAPARIESPSGILTQLDIKKTPCRSPKGPTPKNALAAFEAYNATALRCGLAQAAKLTPDRQRKITARLRDYGLDGWNQALANIERSSFLTGANDRGWRANLEFLLQPSSFAKVHDGGYGNGRHAAEDRTYKPMKFFEPTPEELEAIRA